MLRAALLVLTLDVVGCASRPLYRAEHAPPPGTSLFGATLPLYVVALAADSQWVAFEQAREDTNGDGHIRMRGFFPGGPSLSPGDRTRLYLARRSGQELVYDEHRGHGFGDRFLVFAREERLVLVQAASGVEHDIGPASYAGRPLGIAFAVDAPRLAYVRPHLDVFEIVLRDLVTHEEHVALSAVSPRVALELDSRGDWLRILTPRGDRQPFVVSRRGYCRRPEVVDSRRGVARIQLFHVPTGHPMDDVLAPWGEEGALVERDGALLVQTFDGAMTPLVPASCDPEVACVSSQRRTAVVACRAPGAQLKVAAYREGQAPLPLDAPAPRDELFEWGSFDEASANVLQSRKSRAPWLMVAIESGIVRPLPEGNLFWASGTRYAIRDGDHVVTGDITTGEQGTVLQGVTGSRQWIFGQGAIYGIDPFVFELPSGRILGRFQGRPEALTADGTLLFARVPRRTGQVAEGPLWWERPAWSASPG